jgi:streptomycin 6-kinase
VSELPERFIKTTLDLYGQTGQIWLENLPPLLAETEQRWEFKLEGGMYPLSYNFTAPGIGRDGLLVVLKAGFPNPELTCEIEALRLFGGKGAVRIFEADPDIGVFLMERLIPGEPLARVPADIQATAHAAEVMRNLWVPLPPEHPFPSVSDWAKGLKRLRAQFEGGTGPFPTRLVEAAERLFDELIISMESPLLLHGDLHYHNILSARRRPWLAIDPKGLAGEPAYETGALLRNPMPEIARRRELQRFLERRARQLSEELDLDLERVLGWGTAQALLSAWWSYEDHGREGQGRDRVR